MCNETLDSPDMKRLTRTHDGKAERYGFDLSPLMRRFDELEAYRIAFIKTYKEGQKLRRAISVTRNQCLSLIDKLAEYGFEDAMEKVAEIQAVVSQAARTRLIPLHLAQSL